MKYQVLFSLKKNNEKYSRLLSAAVVICAVNDYLPGSIDPYFLIGD